MHLAAMSVMIVLAAPAADPVRMAPAAVDTDEAIAAKLIEALNEKDWDTRQNLAVALAKLSPTSITPLTQALNDKNTDRRSAAAYALGLIGTSAKSALPSLLELLKDTDSSVRRSASYAISRILPANSTMESEANRPNTRGSK